MFDFFKVSMQISNNYNSISFSSLRCPVKPFTIQTSKGTLYCSEMDYTKIYKTSFYKKLGQFFLDIFANTSSHPFWKKCRKPTLDKKVYDDYINSSVSDYIKFFSDPDTTVIFAKDKRNRLIGAIHTRKLNLNKVLRDEDTLYVDGLAVNSKYRGQNIGKTLLEKVLDASKERFSQVFLVAYKESAKFYEKLGFERMNPKDSSQRYAIKKLSAVRIDYPQYADYMQKDLGKKPAQNWYERIKNNR